MKISVITWDASFRESYHTIDSFGNQKYDFDKYEFIWCDFYNNQNDNLLKKIKKYNNFRLFNMNNNFDEKWHLGRIINYGIKRSSGDILVIPDGDIIVPPDFLSKVEDIFNNSCDDNLVVYFRRYDEPKNKHTSNSYNIEYLKKVSLLNNLSNYGGCLAISYNTFKKIGFYDEHDIFSGAGANAFEQYLRFRNRGLKVMWSNVPIYHPFHNFTGKSDKKKLKLKLASYNYNWINPYNGLEQSYIIRMRNKNLDWMANNNSIDRYLKNLKPINYYLIPPYFFKVINKLKKS